MTEATRKARVFHALEGSHEPGHRASRAVRLIAALIVLNMLAIVLESIEPVRAAYGSWLTLFEWASVAVFTVEYGLRLWSCTSDPRYARPVAGRLRYATTAFALIDLAAILPTYLAFAVGTGGIDFTFLRALRLLRLVRVLKLGRYTEASHVFSRVIEERKHELGVTAGIAMVFLLVTSSVMYEAEREAQPDKFSSIPASMWWGVVTLGTVGYGDVFPVTTLGKVAGGATILVGIAIVAMPTAILASGFLSELERSKKAKPCPHCGKLESDPVESRRVEVLAPAQPPKP